MLLCGLVRHNTVAILGNATRGVDPVGPVCIRRDGLQRAESLGLLLKYRNDGGKVESTYINHNVRPLSWKVRSTNRC